MGDLEEPEILEELDEDEEESYRSLDDDIKKKLLDARIVSYIGDIGRSSAASLTRDLEYLGAVNTKPIKVILNSVGGEVYAGFMIYNTIKSLINQGIDVTVEARGLAASMGCIVLQAGSRRVAPKNTRFLIHEVSSWDWGKVSELEDHVKETRKVNNMLRDIISERSGRSKKEIDKLWTKKDVWYSAEEAKEFGLIDEVL